jgi:uncharacterized lipoprotein YajG
MTGPFMSVRADRLDPAKLEQVLSRYLMYERIRLFRSRLIPRFAVLLLACWTLSSRLHLLPAVALSTAVILIGATTATVVTAERRARRQLAQTLRESCR